MLNVERLFRLFFGALMSFVLCLPVSLSASAEVLVIGSNVSGFKVGSLLSDLQVVTVGKGQTLRLMLPSGRTKVIKGPAKAEVAELTKNQTRNEKIWNMVLASLKAKGGSSSSRIGAVRGMVAAPKPNATPAAFSLKQVPLGGGGTVCIAKGDGVSVSRLGDGLEAGDVTLFNAKAGTKGKVTFAAGESEVAWPANLPLADGHYAIIAAGQPMQQVQVRVLEAEPAEDALLSVLAERGCTKQTSLYLATLEK